MSSIRWRRPRSEVSLLMVVCALAGCGTTSAGTHADDPKSGSVVGQAVPDLELSPLNGGTAVRLSELRGKVVLLDVWASWCAPCKEELPMLDDMIGRVRRKGVEIVAVSIDDNRQDAEAFLQSRPNWSLRLAHDPEGQVPAKLQPPKMPSSYVIDRTGVIRELNAGFSRSDAQGIEARLVELADAPSAEASAASVAQAAAVPATSPDVQNGSANDSPTPSEPVVKGSIDGKPFAPKIAHVTGRMQRDGRVPLSLSERMDCVRPGDAKPGDATLTILVPWKVGYKGDLASLKRGAKSGAVTFSRVNRFKKNELSKGFKPRGTVTIVSAPMEQNAVGKMKLDLSSGDYTIAGELDIQVCVSPK